MDDLYCPSCRLIVSRRGVGRVAPRHCPRCAARRRLVTLLALDQLPPTEPPFEPSHDALNAARSAGTVALGLSPDPPIG
jgi:hypothetical protein